MANLKELNTQIQNTNELGVANLTNKGVEISENATTYEIMQAIAKVVGGDFIIGGNYTSIVYNEDDTITLTDKDGTTHTMECTYEDDKLIGVTYDGKAVELTYDGDVLVQVGNTEVDMVNAPVSSGGATDLLEHTVTFIVDNEPYEVVSVKDGNSVNAPATEPTLPSGKFYFVWQDGDDEVSFPYTPSTNTELVAVPLDVVHPEYEIAEADFVLANIDTTEYVKKVNSDVCFLAGMKYSMWGNWRPCLIGETQASVELTKAGILQTVYTTTYNDKTWYYSYSDELSPDYWEFTDHPYIILGTEGVVTEERVQSAIQYYLTGV